MSAGVPNADRPSRDVRIGRAAGFVIWGLAAVLVLEFLAIAVNLLVPSIFGDVPNPDFDSAVPGGNRFDRVEAQWAGHLSAIAPWWLVLAQALVTAAIVIIVWPRSRWVFAKVGPAFLFAAPVFGGILAAFLAGYAWTAGRFDSVDGLGPFTIGFIIASIVAVITLISSLILAFPAARAGRAFEAQIRAERANRTKGR